MQRLETEIRPKVFIYNKTETQGASRLGRRDGVGNVVVRRDSRRADEAAGQAERCWRICKWGERRTQA